jgi:hypothetical protein
MLGHGQRESAARRAQGSDRVRVGSGVDVSQLGQQRHPQAQRSQRGNSVHPGRRGGHWDLAQGGGMRRLAQAERPPAAVGREADGVVEFARAALRG